MTFAIGNEPCVDPYRNFKFHVKCSGLPFAGVSTVSALKRSREIIEHRGGGDPGSLADRLSFVLGEASDFDIKHGYYAQGAVRGSGPRRGSVQRSAAGVLRSDRGARIADRFGRIFLSSNAFQHIEDELILKDRLWSSTSPLSFFLHTDLNSIFDPSRAYYDTRGNGFLQRRKARATLGLELATERSGIQYFARGSMGVEVTGLRRPGWPDFSGTAGIRFRFR